MSILLYPWKVANSESQKPTGKQWNFNDYKKLSCFNHLAIEVLMYRNNVANEFLCGIPVPLCVSWRSAAANSHKEAQQLWQHIFITRVMHNCKNIMHGRP